MEEVMKLTDQFVYTTSTAEVTTPDDFIVEFLADMTEQSDPKIIKIKNLDELLDFLETIYND